MATEINDRGAEALAAAVVVQAIRDWAYYRRMAGTEKEGSRQYHDGTIVRQHAYRLQDVERFFYGKWIWVLCDIDGVQLLEKLRSMNMRNFSLSGMEQYRKEEKTPYGGSWQRLGAFPELQNRLWKHDIRQMDICNELGISGPTLAGWIKKGLSGERLELVSGAADRIIQRRAT